MKLLYQIFLNVQVISSVLLAEGVFMQNLQKRKYFALRLLIVVSVCLTLSYVVLANQRIVLSWFSFFAISELYGSDAVGYTIIWLTLYLVTIAGQFILFEGKGKDILFRAVAAYAMQNLAFQIERILFALIGTHSEPIDVLVKLGVFFSVYLVCYFVFAKRLIKGECVNVSNGMVIGLAFIVVTICIVLNPYAIALQGRTELEIILEGAFALVCFMTLSFQFGLFHYEKLRLEKKAMEVLLEEQKKQYEISKENIEIINVKCHDLRHQIRDIRLKEGEIDRADLEQIENAVSIYDSAIKTGNKIVDIILTEKALYCERNGIRLEVIADGEQLAFMSTGDLYSLFGNIMDNAIEAVKQIDEIDMRIVELRICRTGALLSVRAQNYYCGKLEMQDGLPVTQKEDKDNHGFGLRSIQLVVEKYGGTMSIATDLNIFSLALLFPIKNK